MTRTATYRRTNVKTGETTVVRCQTEHDAEAFADALESWNTQQPETWHYAPIAVTDIDAEGFTGVVFVNPRNGEEDPDGDAMGRMMGSNQ